MKDTENLPGLFKIGDNLFKNNIKCFGISSDLNGEITELFYDGLNIKEYISTKKTFLNLVDDSSIGKAIKFLETIKNKSFALDWELNLPIESKIKIIHFLGFLVEDKILIFGIVSLSEMIRVTEILNKLNINLSQALISVLKNFDIQLPKQRFKDNELFEEIGRLNNELTNTKRELTKKNIEQIKLIERLKEQTGLLKERDEEFRNFFDNSMDAVVLSIPDGPILNANSAAEKMFGYTREEICKLGRNGIADDQNPNFQKLLNIREHKGKVNGEHYFIKKDGTKFLAEISASVYNDKNGNKRSSIIIRDITERKKAEYQMKISLNEKEVLIREIHHRVKNNLQIIASLLHLQECTVDSDVAAVLRESEGRVRSMATIHENLYQSPTFNDINIKNYIEKLLYDILYTYGISKGKIKTDLDIQDIKLNIDTAIPLGLVINELVTNIVKYAFNDMGGTITIKLKSYPNGMELIIADDGIGLPEDIDIENSETLGLQLINNLINQIDGELKIDNADGTEFKIFFNELKYKKRT